jgi:hypothetical protein
MKSKRKSKQIIILSAICTILLCTASFLLGAYTVSRAYDKSNTADISDDGTNTQNTATGIAAGNQDQDLSSENTASVSDDSTQAAAGDSSQPALTPTIEPDNGNVIYNNSKYGFQITLPAGWEGFTVQTEDWQGVAYKGEQQGQVVEAGTTLIIRHPDWTVDHPRQDIPIMIYTPDQWDKVENEEISVSAAPIIPTKLTENSDYVFALPARYNYAFQTGYEEVEQIIQENFFPDEN